MYIMRQLCAASNGKLFSRRPTSLILAAATGGVVLYALGVAYMVLGLVVVNNHYFMPSLRLLSHKLRLTDDVAGDLGSQMRCALQTLLCCRSRVLSRCAGQKSASRDTLPAALQELQCLPAARQPPSCSLASSHCWRPSLQFQLPPASPQPWAQATRIW